MFAHEFGHAFGLPDLYDTDPDNGDSEGIGNWCLMAGGSWGGDGLSPEKPVHMSAWAKEFLGWVNPTNVAAELNPASLKSAEDNADVLKVPISASQWYLVENRQKKLFDTKLPAGGLLVWKINQAVVTSGLASNSVNADENNKGVDLEEADGLAHLDAGANRGDAGDAFPGSANKREFHNATSPPSSGTNAICVIADAADTMTAVVRVASGTCARSRHPDADADGHAGSHAHAAGRWRRKLLRRPGAAWRWWRPALRLRIALAAGSDRPGGVDPRPADAGAGRTALTSCTPR